MPPPHFVVAFANANSQAAYDKQQGKMQTLRDQTFRFQAERDTLRARIEELTGEFVPAGDDLPADAADVGDSPAPIGGGNGSSSASAVAESGGQASRLGLVEVYLRKIADLEAQVSALSEENEYLRAHDDSPVGPCAFFFFLCVFGFFFSFSRNNFQRCGGACADSLRHSCFRATTPVPFLDSLDSPLNYSSFDGADDEEFDDSLEGSDDDGDDDDADGSGADGGDDDERRARAKRRAARQIVKLEEAQVRFGGR